MITPQDALLRLEAANPMPLPTDIDDDTFADVWAIIETGFDEAPAPAPQTLRQPAAPQWRRPIAVAAAAFVIVIAVIGIVALLRNAETPVAETSTTVAPETTTTTTAPSTTTTAVPETATTVPSPTTTTLPPKPASLEITWQRIPTSPALEDGWIAAVTEGGPGFVAVGGSSEDAGVWLSADGVTWERVTSPSFSGEATRTYPGGATSDGDQYFSDVVVGPAGIVAVGLDQLINTEGPAGETERPGIWWSADGRTWENVSRPEIGDGGVFFDAAPLWRVVRLDDRYVAVGGLDAWASDDGRSWERHEIGSEPETGVGELIVWDGRVVAIGGSGERPAVWISDDGTAWERIADPDFDANAGSFMGVAPVADGLIALQVEWPRLIPWRTSDGADWTRLDVSIESDVWEFSPRSGLLVAAGTGSIAGDITLITDPYAMWGTADDGDAWYQLGEFDGGMLEALGSGSPHFFNALNDLIVAGDRLIAVGKFVEWSGTEDLGSCYRDDSSGSCRADAAVWIGSWQSP